MSAVRAAIANLTRAQAELDAARAQAKLDVAEAKARRVADAMARMNEAAKVIDLEPLDRLILGLREAFDSWRGPSECALGDADSSYVAAALTAHMTSGRRKLVSMRGVD